jgi:hypothetical protein
MAMGKAPFWSANKKIAGSRLPTLSAATARHTGSAACTAFVQASTNTATAIAAPTPVLDRADNPSAPMSPATAPAANQGG